MYENGHTHVFNMINKTSPSIMFTYKVTLKKKI